MEENAAKKGALAGTATRCGIFRKGKSMEENAAAKAKEEGNAEGPWWENGLCHIINPENHGNNIILGNGVFRIASPYTFALSIPGIGLRSTVLSEQEFAVIRPVILRMFGLSR
jgi:hypothetical protein